MTVFYLFRAYVGLHQLREALRQASARRARRRG